jgi:hypothetical protein
MIRLLVAIALAGCVMAQTRDSSERNNPALLTLTAGSSKSLPVAGFGGMGAARCDSSQNLYFHATRNFNNPTILKILKDGSTEVYTVPDENAGRSNFMSYRVTFDGRLEILVEQSKELSVVEFGNSPSSSTRVKLDFPTGLSVYSVRTFVPLRDGRFLLHAFGDVDASQSESGQGYLLEFDSAGRLLKQENEKVLSTAVKEVVHRASDEGAVEAENGYIYLLEPNQVLVVSQAGEIARTIPFDPPGPDYKVRNLSTDQGRLLITFFGGEKESLADPRYARPLSARYAMLDATTGQQLRLYQPTPELGNNLVCFSSEGLTFIRFVDGRVKLFTAPVD